MPRGWPVGFRTATAQRSSLLSAISYLAIVTWLLFSFFGIFGIGIGMGIGFGIGIGIIPRAISFQAWTGDD